MYYLNNVDWHVTDRCNLRCISCGHFCPLVNYQTLEYDRTIEDAEKDFKILYEKTNNGEFIKNITLTGGECTLNKQLPEIIEVAEKYFNHKVTIWSNCINLSLYNQHLLEIIRKYNITINITLYKPERKERILEFFNKQNINIQLFDKNFTGNDNPEFFKSFFTLDPIPNNENLLWCEPKFNCCQLKEQKLYVCQYMAYLPYLFDYFKNNNSKKIGFDNSNKYLDLNEINNYQEIEQYILNYNEEICQHCIDKWSYVDFQEKVYKRVQPWKVSNKEIGEWIIKNINEL